VISFTLFYGKNPLIIILRFILPFVKFFAMSEYLKSKDNGIIGKKPFQNNDGGASADFNGVLGSL
jgi:hypothetical protein